ncbi:metallophosphoesterase [Bordetella petrii]|nr:LamG-like jellyroll fold domain-containing protein [Bordetella petrii]MCD0502883.1 metallophosphoesterase [Bordetella petrii]
MGASTLLTACGSGNDDDDDGSGDPGTPGPNPDPDPGPAQVSSFGLVVLPDTQFYSRYAAEETGNQFRKLYGSEPYLAQTQWIARNAAALKVPFVIHVGDIVDQAGHPQQWEVANTAMEALETGGVPYSVLAGNHDVLRDVGYDSDPAGGTDADRDLTQEPYLQWFGAERAGRQPTFGGRDTSGFHEYHIFEAEGQQFLVLSLSWRVSDAGLAWASQVLRKHPTLPAILVNHELLAIDKDGTTPLEVNYGLMLWDKLIRSHDQIFMTLNGHFHGAAHLTKTNDFGNPVEQMVVDYQMAYQGGNGLLRFYEFDLTNNRIHALSFSPWVPEKPSDTINEFDQAMLTDANNQFSIEFDFARRFANFNPDFKAAAAGNTSLAAAATALVLDGYEDQVPPSKEPATDEEDYPHVAETVAHWRFAGGTAGTAVAEGMNIADRSGNNNGLTRAPLDEPAGNPARMDDLLWSDDRHHLSAAPGSISFLNAGGNRLSYFMTDAAAAINGETFANGYTVEAFIKIDKNWTAATNAWMNIMTRAGRRGNLPGFAGGLPQSPPLQFAISNLREVQWEVIPEATESGARSSRTNWSGEIMVDTWLHIAVVNDPATRSSTMYVEGAPVLRNPIDTVGLATLGLPWAVGAGFWDGGPPGSGFLGALSEIRVVARPLPPEQWLTARAAR